MDWRTDGGDRRHSVGTLAVQSDRLDHSGLAIELGVFAVIASALSGEILLSGGLYAGVLGTLATLIPSAPGHWGTFDFFAAEGFRYSGFEAEKAVAAAIVCHLVIIVPVTLIGGFQLVDQPTG